MKTETTIQQEVLTYLKDKSYPLTTRQIARNAIYKKEYDENEAYYGNKVIVVPGKSSVQGAYKILRKMKDRGLIEYVERGMWMINR